MSRRREAAELAIALSLSTQEVNRLPQSEISSPSYNKFTFSSGSGSGSGNPTQDSKDMELRPYLPPDGSGSLSGVHTGVGYGYGLPPSIGTVRPEDVMKAPSGRTESVQGSSNGSSGGKQTSSAYNTSIHSFPSPSINKPQAIIPATNSNSHPPTSSSGNSSNPPIPTSFPHRRQPNSSNPNSVPIPSPAWSSPIPSHLPSHVSSTELSSNRPLFSSTQGSGIPPPITPDPRPTVLKTYGKASKNTPSPQKLQKNNAIILSSSPPSEPPLNSPIRSKILSPTKKRKNIVLSDNEEEEEEEEEPIEFRTPAPVLPIAPSSKSRVEVVLPKSKPSSVSKERRKDLSQDASSERDDELRNHTNRHHSPDPLDSLKGSGNTPVRNSTKTTQSTNHPSSSAVTTASSSTHGMTDSSSRRISSRVADNKAKEAAEKEERRRKRREEKERQKAREESKLSNKSKTSSSTGNQKDKEKVPEPSEKTPIVLKIAQRPPISEKGSISEPIEIEDSLIEPQPKPKQQLEPKGKKRKSDIAAIDHDDGSDGDFDPSAADDSGKGKSKKAKKGKKEPVNKGKAAAKKAVEVVPEPGLEPEVVEQPLEEVKEKESEIAEKEEVTKEPSKSPTPPPPPPPAKSISPVRPPLRATSSNVSTPSASSVTHRPSPGPMTKEGTPSAPGGIKWKAPRNDLTSVLAKFGGAKRSGLTKKLKIVPLHAKIGTPVKALPPAPKKPEKKKVDEDEDEDEEDGGGSEDENGNKQLKKAKKTLEWLMMED